MGLVKKPKASQIAAEALKNGKARVLPPAPTTLPFALPLVLSTETNSSEVA